ncbi:MAG: ATP-binding protein, partial [Firmicutes bacterium]|nr:ATP-binding protein [Bacillota bacterium]
MIKILDKHVADKIAAGEVIDRPVSIIKELLENSLDAEATSIAIEIKNGGKSYIRVTDNGCGIPADEVELAFRRHATSKITAAEDLDAIETLGFRGEALASICAVARVELITKTADSKMGRKVVIEGSEVLENSAIGCPDGTTITVRDLFFNVPARSKFLATDSAETRRIVDMVSRIALSYGDVKISLTSGSSKVFSTRGNGNILNN